MLRGILLLVVALVPSVGWAQTTRPNVLLICVDDLRPELGCYGVAGVHTPNIDRLAASGVRFSNQFVAVPTCGASRYALLTGRRPSRPIDLSNNAFQQLRRPDPATTSPAPTAPATTTPATAPAAAGPETFIHLFRRNGYRTVGIGKISHHPDGRVYGYNRPVSDILELPNSWDEMRLPYGPWRHGWEAFFAYADGTGRTGRLGAKQSVPPTEAADVPDTGYPDGLIARDAVAQLGELKRRSGEGQPFFLAVGFFKPHLPFTAPKKYWDLYPEESDLSPAPNPPKGVHPNLALHDSAEARQYTHPDQPADWRSNEPHARQLRRGYRAAVSYVDAQVGLVLDELERQGLAGNTIVILWGDHGFHLGDLTVWGKHTLFDYALRSPLIVRAPGVTAAGRVGGGEAAGIVESIDLYPTLAELCALPAPENLGGRSFRAQLADPAAAGKPFALSYWTGGGVSIRTAQYRLTRYQRPQNRGVIYELYDLRADPQETVNVAGEMPEVVASLSAQLPPPPPPPPPPAPSPPPPGATP